MGIGICTCEHLFLLKPEDCIGYPEDGLTGVYVLPNLSSKKQILQKQYALLTAMPSFQPQVALFFNDRVCVAWADFKLTT